MLLDRSWGIKMAKLSQVFLRNRFQFLHEILVMVTASWEYTSTCTRNQREMAVSHAIHRKLSKVLHSRPDSIIQNYNNFQRISFLICIFWKHTGLLNRVSWVLKEIGNILGVIQTRWFDITFTNFFYLPWLTPGIVTATRIGKQLWWSKHTVMSFFSVMEDQILFPLPQHSVFMGLLSECASLRKERLRNQTEEQSSVTLTCCSQAACINVWTNYRSSLAQNTHWWPDLLFMEMTLNIWKTKPSCLNYSLQLTGSFSF